MVQEEDIPARVVQGEVTQELEGPVDPVVEALVVLEVDIRVQVAQVVPVAACPARAGLEVDIPAAVPVGLVAAWLVWGTWEA